jgi:hypothetical protein
MQAVEKGIKNLEVYDSTFTPDIFICNDRSLYAFFTFWVGLNSNSQAFNLCLLNNTFVNMTKVKYLNFYHDKRLHYTHINGDLSQIISHELVHNLDCRFSGFSRYIEKPEWKKEGYAEYGSTIALINADTKYSLFKRASFLFENNLFNTPQHSKRYYKYQLMVEYLFTEKGFGIELLNRKQLDEKSISEELELWYYTKKKEFEEQI